MTYQTVSGTFPKIVYINKHLKIIAQQSELPNAPGQININHTFGTKKVSRTYLFQENQDPTYQIVVREGSKIISSSDEFDPKPLARHRTHICKMGQLLAGKGMKDTGLHKLLLEQSK